MLLAGFDELLGIRVISGDRPPSASHCAAAQAKPPDGICVVVSVSVGFGLLLQAASNTKKGSNVT
ncbi:hypothetical protein ACLB1N_32080 [Escherichia coli]